MKASKTLIPLALFVVAFAGSLFALRGPGLPAAAPVVKLPAAQSFSGTRSPGAITLAGAGSQAASDSKGASSDGDASVDGDARPLDAATAANVTGQSGASASARPVVPPTPVPAAASAASTDDLSAALPPDPPPPLDDVGQAIDTLRTGASDDRVRAIQSLALTAQSGRSLSRVRQTLRFAASDQDPDVAARAQEAYDALTKREDP